METINLFGGKGFVGSQYCKQTNLKTICNFRNDYEVYDKNVLYLISTVHNYNVLQNSFVDIDTNLTTLMRILDNYRKFPGDGCFNFISSWFVYGKDSGYGDGAVGISENSSCDPKGFYSITKRCAEQLLMSYCETFNLNYRILRLCNVIGNGDKFSAQKNALQYMVNEIKNGKPVQLYDGGRFYRDYIDVRDCARAIDLVIQRGELNQIYNIGNGVPQEFGKLIQYAKIATKSNSEITVIEQKEFHKKVQSSRSFFMDTHKLKSLGYAPQYSIFDTLDSIID